LSAPEVLGPGHDISHFSCGKPALDNWLRLRAVTSQQRGFTVVMVIHDEGRVAGYYGLAPTAIAPSVVPRSIRTGQPPDPLPCLLLGQLAVDLSFAGRGVGYSLLHHALGRCVAGAKLIGGRAVMVTAVDTDAAGFWRRWGFLPSEDDPLVLFRSTVEIAASLEAIKRGAGN
jgi:GNAT superfamily N-acetyltransferase